MTPSSLPLPRLRWFLRISLFGLLFLPDNPAAAQFPMPGQQKQAEVFGQTIHYAEAGTGPAVVLLHGLGGDMSNWALTLPALAARHRVLVPDQIGFGRSAKPQINYRVGTMVDFLHAFLKKTGVERATLVGNSLGGWIATAYALAYPARVDKLVLVDSAGFALPVTREQLLALNPSTLAGQRALLRLIFYNADAFVSDSTVEMFFAEKLKRGDGYAIDRFLDSIVRKDDVLDGKLGALRVPVLVLWGREDVLTPLMLGERFAKEIGGAQLVVLEKCGHLPQIEKAAEFNAALLKFLGAAGPAS